MQVQVAEQREVIAKYFKRRGEKPLREISNETGIQMTRVFRILNGQEMKLSEYLCFKE